MLLKKYLVCCVLSVCRMCCNCQKEEKRIETKRERYFTFSSPSPGCRPLSSFRLSTESGLCGTLCAGTFIAAEAKDDFTSSMKPFRPTRSARESPRGPCL